MWQLAGAGLCGAVLPLPPRPQAPGGWGSGGGRWEGSHSGHLLGRWAPRQSAVSVLATLEFRPGKDPPSPLWGEKKTTSSQRCNKFARAAWRPFARSPGLAPRCSRSPFLVAARPGRGRAQSQLRAGFVLGLVLVDGRTRQTSGGQALPGAVEGLATLCSHSPRAGLLAAQLLGPGLAKSQAAWVCQPSRVTGSPP